MKGIFLGHLVLILSFLWIPNLGVSLAYADAFDIPCYQSGVTENFKNAFLPCSEVKTQIRIRALKTLNQYALDYYKGVRKVYKGHDGSQAKVDPICIFDSKNMNEQQTVCHKPLEERIPVFSPVSLPIVENENDSNLQCAPAELHADPGGSGPMDIPSPAENALYTAKYSQLSQRDKNLLGQRLGPELGTQVRQIGRGAYRVTIEHWTPDPDFNLLQGRNPHGPVREKSELQFSINLGSLLAARYKAAEKILNDLDSSMSLAVQAACRNDSHLSQLVSMKQKMLTITHETIKDYKTNEDRSVNVLNKFDRARQAVFYSAVSEFVMCNIHALAIKLADDSQIHIVQSVPGGTVETQSSANQSFYLLAGVRLNLLRDHVEKVCKFTEFHPNVGEDIKTCQKQHAPYYLHQLAGAAPGEGVSYHRSFGNDGEAYPSEGLQMQDGQSCNESLARYLRGKAISVCQSQGGSDCESVVGACAAGNPVDDYCRGALNSVAETYANVPITQTAVRGVPVILADLSATDLPAQMPHCAQHIGGIVGHETHKNCSKDKLSKQVRMCARREIKRLYLENAKEHFKLDNCNKLKQDLKTLPLKPWESIPMGDEHSFLFDFNKENRYV